MKKNARMMKHSVAATSNASNYHLRSIRANPVTISGYL